ncbi:MAG: TRAP transporter large permease subunit, partial [Desulfobulbaceae bacterium]|nr:TRAP transporter large permease subunit [Desulfobulbaceae bacterium]
LVAIASLVLGMGVPVTAAYLITAVLAVPPLMEMGVVLIAAHMIVYWFSQDSNITPPVCVAAYAGAAIAGSDPWKTGWTAFKYAKLLYVVPLLFAFTPQILFEGKPIIGPQIDDEIMGATVLELKVEKGQDFKKGQEIAMLLDGESIKKVIADKEGSIKDFVVSKGQRIESNTIIAETKPSSIMVFSSMFSAILGTIAFSALFMFYLIRKTNIIEWLLLAAGTLLLYWPTFVTDGAGLVVVALVIIMQKARNKKDLQLQPA